ncbi:MAG: CoA transferase [Rhodospirillaceae bacterium]|nr:CoA transferase [Rhodospirillaceae bacterium]MBT5667703.1 CoA transferase [Rhodospirillaceae bacterium]MBT5811659.1 CoA transferase [Rhodospirillaceae bacterium]
MSEARLPLSRYNVIDVTAARAGPTAVRQLADWGANVIKVEAPASIDQNRASLTGSRHGFDFQNLHRNKRALTLNLKTEEGKAVFFDLVKDADVIVENFRSEVKFRLGIDYESVRKVNPRLVYGSISGFGQTGPYGKRPGVDQIAQGLGGLMSITGLPGQGPVRVGIPICDLTSGIFLAQGILMALLDRETTGEGQWVHTSLLESIIQMLDFQGARWLIEGEVAPQAGNNHPTGTPTGVFPTSDGHINIAAAGTNLFDRMNKAMGADDLATDERFRTGEDRTKHREEINERISVHSRKKTSDEWIEILNDAGVPCGPIYSIDQMFANEQVEHLGIAKSVIHAKLKELKIVGQAVNLTETPQPDTLRMPTPDLGEHTDDILKELGYDDAKIAALHENRIV